MFLAFYELLVGRQRTERVTLCSSSDTTVKVPGCLFTVKRQLFSQYFKLFIDYERHILPFLFTVKFFDIDQQFIIALQSTSIFRTKTAFKTQISPSCPGKNWKRKTKRMKKGRLMRFTDSKIVYEYFQSVQALLFFVYLNELESFSCVAH